MPLLPLETWRRIIGYHPWHFWGWSDNDKLKVTSSCNSIVYKYPWLDADQAGRDEILEAIDTAEQRLFEYLGFWVAPKYSETTQSYPRHYDTTLHYGAPVDASGRWIAISLGEGFVQSLGIESLTLLGTVNVTYSDPDDDGIDELFTTAALATTVTDTDEIAVYFAAADRLNSDPVGATYRIQPVTITISGGSVTVKGAAYLLAKPIKYEGVTKATLDPATAANKVTTLEIYRRRTNVDGTTNETSQGLLTWETEPWPFWATGCCCDGAPISSDPAAIATAIARVGVRDARHGLVIPGQAVFDSATSTWAATVWDGCRQPDRITIRYLAGWPLVNGQMDPTWATVVARLATAELARRICACDTANRELHRWQIDAARTGGAGTEEYGAISADDLNNPFGTRLGQIYAWRRVRQLYQTPGLVPG